MTEGEYKVGLDFNPSGSTRVDIVKREAAGLIDRLVEVREGAIVPEAKRLAALAITAFEEGAMWAVKALTKKDWE